MVRRSITFLDPWLRRVPVEATIPTPRADSHLVMNFEAPYGYLTPSRRVFFTVHDAQAELHRLQYPIFLDPKLAWTSPDKYNHDLDQRMLFILYDLANRLTLFGEEPLSMTLGFGMTTPMHYLHLEPDRVWWPCAAYTAGLPIVEAFDASYLWRRAPGMLHKAPEGKNWTRIGSFKENRDHGPTMQIVIWQTENDTHVAEVDLDLESSILGHGMEVLENFITGNTTDPYAAVQSLLVYRGLSPYVLFPGIQPMTREEEEDD